MTALLDVTGLRITIGSLPIVDGIDFANPGQLWRVRGRKVAMVFQDPTSSLHPMLSIERQLTEHVLVHLRMDLPPLPWT